MKKQILILTLFTLALIFAGTNKAYAQPNTNEDAFLPGAAECRDAVPLGCVSDAGALNPLPGETYTYAIEGEGATAITGVQWFVYNATPTSATPAGYGPDIMVDESIATALSNMELTASSDYLMTAEGHYGTMTAVTGAPLPTSGVIPFTIDISWNSFDGNVNEILLVAYVNGDCVNNIEVYRIQPAFSYTLDIAGLMPDGSLNRTGDGSAGSPYVYSNAEECVAPVWDATYTPAAPPGDRLTMDYGANYVYFTVNAANFVDSWEPTFSASHDNGSAITEIAWAYDGTSTTAADWHAANGSGIAAVVEVQAETAGVKDDAVGAAGECIVVRVLVEHGAVENAVVNSVSLIVNGIMLDPAVANDYTNTDLADLDEPASGTGACESDLTTDTSVYDLTPRPDITTLTPDAAGTGVEPFVIKD